MKGFKAVKHHTTNKNCRSTIVKHTLAVKTEFSAVKSKKMERQGEKLQS